MSEFLPQSDVEEIVTGLGPAARDFAGKTVMLSGGRGFLGCYFTALFAYLNEHVLEQPVNLVVLDNLITAGKYGAEAPDDPNLQFIKHDVIQPFAWDAPLHYIVHAAGIASPYYYRAFPLQTLDVSITGTRNLLELAQKLGARLIFFSSSEVYGDPDPRHIPTPESYRGNVSCQGPRACYDESKRVGETLCYVYQHMHGTSTNIIRPFNVFGPGMPETDYRVMPNFASRLKAGLPLNVYAGGCQTRTFCYVTDAIFGFLRVMLVGVPGEVYNIGNPEPEISVLELVQRMEKVLNRKIDLNLIEYPDSYPADEPQRRCPDIRKARVQLEYQPMVDLDEGLHRFFTWAERTYTGAQ